MLDIILKKLNTPSLEEFFENEKKIEQKFEGYEIERESPLSVLTMEEVDFVADYIVEHRESFL